MIREDNNIINSFKLNFEGINWYFINVQNPYIPKLYGLLKINKSGNSISIV